MDYKVLYRKYRPNNFNELVGQDHIVELLLRSVLTNKLSHAYLFTGPRGTGKTSTAKLFAKVINCEKNIEGNPCEKCISCLNYKNSADIIEIDAASNNGVDEIRELRENVKIAPTMSKYKVYIIDEVHMLSSNAWNAFLKTLEEPPKHVIFILATTEINKVPITVMSRCQRFDFQKINDENIINKLKDIAKKEKIKIEDEVLSELAKLADGALRDALGLLDQLSKLSGTVTLQTLKEAYGVLTEKDIDEFIILLKNNQIEDIITVLDNYNSKGITANVFLNSILNSLLSELIRYKTTGIKEIENIESLIIDLEKCYYKKNQFLFLKTSFINNMNVNNVNKINEKEKISLVNEKKDLKQDEIISREIIYDKNYPKINDEIINIRINNSFVNASKELKEEFKKDWLNLEKKFSKSGKTKYLSLFENSSIEVVSPTNVLFSANTFSNSVLFNFISEDLLSDFIKVTKKSLKFVFIDKDRWKKERDKFIKSKNKNYSLIKEPKTEEKNQAIDAAEKLFGDSLVEIK